MSSKKSSRTVLGVIKRVSSWENGGVLFMPYSEAPLICPSMISPLKGRKTIRRNSTGNLQPLSFEAEIAGPTINIHNASTMADQTVGGVQYIVNAYAKPDLLNYLQRC